MEQLMTWTLVVLLSSGWSAPSVLKVDGFPTAAACEEARHSYQRHPMAWTAVIETQWVDKEFHHTDCIGPVIYRPEKRQQ